MSVGAARLLVVLLGAVLVLDVRIAGGETPGGASRITLEVRQRDGQKGEGRDFPDIASAINSVTDASNEKRYVVRIAPGTYPVPPGGIAMKPFVDLEGSGPAATLIEGAVAAGVPLWVQPLNANQPAVVMMAGDSWLRHLTVRNRSAEGGIAVYFPMTANAGAEDVTVEAIGVMKPGRQYDYQAIRVQGPGAEVTIDRVTARHRMEVPPDSGLTGDNVAIGVFNSGKLLVKNSHAIAENGWWNIGIASERESECVVRDSVIEVSGLSEGAYAFIANGTRDEAHKTAMTVKCSETDDWGCAAVLANRGSAVTVQGSDLRVTAGARTANSAMLLGAGTVSASRLSGPVVYELWKLVDCTDGELRPIPNQP